jgi:hypothetical protein
MAVYVPIDDANLEPNKYVRSVDGIALKNNPTAIAEGASGAPRFQAAAMTTGDDMAEWFGNIYKTTEAGVVGSLMYGTFQDAATEFTGYVYSQPIVGSALRPSGSVHADVAMTVPTDSALSGTWMCLGFNIKTVPYQTTSGTTPVNNFASTLWVRIA